jgi:KipI family sensor histidine kinase inhibitor
MTLVPLGELAILVRGLKHPVAVATWINDVRPNGVSEAVPAYDTLGLYFDEAPDFESVRAILLERDQLPDPVIGRKLEVPCSYDGEDLAEVAERSELAVEQVIELHANHAYKCFALGFSPGFAYLGYLDERLVLPRRAEPRRSVPAGSVAIAGRQTAVYPSSSPGGWWLLGTTTMRLVDIEAGFYAIQAGDEVRFVPA